jgi:very-short-patch-repair endonuclease
MLWEAVRAKRLAGLKFCRQFPIDRYVVDFACRSARLVVELDGPWHEENADYDLARTEVIEALGWFVLRFPSKAVIDGSADVLNAIVRHVEQFRGESS